MLCFTLHHVVSDGWSMQVLVREVSALYAAARRGVPAPLPELPVQYADYAVWQRGRLVGETLEALVGFWTEALRGAPPLLEIPTDRPRGAGQDPRAASHAFVLPPGLSQALRGALAQGGGHAVHDAAGRVAGAARPPLGAGTTWWWGAPSRAGTGGRRRG